MEIARAEAEITMVQAIVEGQVLLGNIGAHAPTDAGGGGASGGTWAIPANGPDSALSAPSAPFADLLKTSSPPGSSRTTIRCEIRPILA